MKGYLLCSFVLFQNVLKFTSETVARGKQHVVVGLLLMFVTHYQSAGLRSALSRMPLADMI